MSSYGTQNCQKIGAVCGTAVFCSPLCLFSGLIQGQPQAAGNVVYGLVQRLCPARGWPCMCHTSLYVFKVELLFGVLLMGLWAGLQS